MVCHSYLQSLMFMVSGAWESVCSKPTIAKSWRKLWPELEEAREEPERAREEPDQAAEAMCEV